MGTLVRWAAAAVAAWLLHRHVAGTDLGSVAATARWGWVLVAGCLSTLTLAGAAVNLMAVSPVRLEVRRTVAAQLAGGFAKLVSPAAIGAAALNVRFVQRAGAPTPGAVATVGAAQLVQLATTVLLLVLVGVTSGQTALPRVLPGPGVWVAVGAVVLGGSSALGFAPVRRLLRSRLAPMRQGLGPLGTSLREAVRRLLLAATGSLLLTGALVLCLAASVAAFGGAPDLRAVAVVLLAGTALGSLVPTPGGLGAVDAALVAGLTAAGHGASVAVPAVLVFRLVTVWLPVPLGWFALRGLQRRGHL